jgi:hypothetical protein
VSFVLGLALGARLGTVLALVLIAGAADREATDVTGGEEPNVRRRADSIAADLTHLGPSMLRRFLRVLTHKKERKTTQNTSKVQTNPALAKGNTG